MTKKGKDYLPRESDGEKDSLLAPGVGMSEVDMTKRKDSLLAPIIYIYISVLTCRQNIINSSASAPLNATKIAVKKVCDVDVCMFGSEL